jgi:hypothetical protein
MIRQRQRDPKKNWEKPSVIRLTSGFAESNPAPGVDASGNS